MAARSRRTTRWTPAAIPIGMLMMVLGAWAFFVPLVGPYFNYGLFTDQTWVFSNQHWELLLLPGIVVFLGGMLMTMPAAGLTGLGGLLAIVGGAWLLVGRSLYPLWTSSTGVGVGVPHSETIDALLWIGYFYGTGALVMYFSGFGHGLISRRPVVRDETVIHETPVERSEERIVTNA